MTAERTPLFCDTALAERIERAETQLVAKAARAAHRRNHGRGFVLSLAGGVASFAERPTVLALVAISGLIMNVLLFPLAGEWSRRPSRLADPANADTDRAGQRAVSG